MDAARFLKLLKFYSMMLPKGCPDFNNELVIRYWWDKIGQHNEEEQLKEVFEHHVTIVGFFPQLSDFHRKLGSGEMSEDDYAASASARITGAVSKFGWCNPDYARKYLDDICWKVIEDMGGWASFCDSLTNDNLPTVRAQIREALRARAKHPDQSTLRLGGKTNGNNKETSQIKSPLQKALSIVSTGKEDS